MLYTTEMNKSLDLKTSLVTDEKITDEGFQEFATIHTSEDINRFEINTLVHAKI